MSKKKENKKTYVYIMVDIDVRSFCDTNGNYVQGSITLEHIKNNLALVSKAKYGITDNAKRFSNHAVTNSTYWVISLTQFSDREKALNNEHNELGLLPKMYGRDQLINAGKNQEIFSRLIKNAELFLNVNEIQKMNWLFD